MVNIILTGDQQLRNCYARYLLTQPDFVNDILPCGITITIDLWLKMSYNNPLVDQYSEKNIMLSFGVLGDLKSGLPSADSFSKDVYGFWVTVIERFINEFPNHYEFIDKKEMLRHPQHNYIFKYPNMAGEFSSAGHWFKTNQIRVVNLDKGEFTIPNKQLQESLFLKNVEAVYRIPHRTTISNGLVGIHTQPKEIWMDELFTRWKDIIKEDKKETRIQILIDIARIIPGIGPSTMRLTASRIDEEWAFWRANSHH